ncbi:nucleotidyltransferase family protein [Sphingobium sp. H39-3-25]|uniref:nucleotidyltransferase family protein n=1 Tax=Sphingobium arseniciresistens TaxID=3030834 RepID=UPI0023B8CFB2|nr:nucleotidyltransferase family protein [Sphingobium arseniciresistens]
MIRPDRVAAVLLAAGASRRFGQENKLLADLNGRALVTHAASVLAEVGFACRIAVCAPEDDAVAALLAPLGFVIVRGRVDRTDMAASLSVGVASAMAHDVDAVLMCLGDMPFISAAHVDALLLAHGDRPLAVTASFDGAHPMPPALLGRGHFAALQAMQGDKGARDLLADAARVPAPALQLRDIDRPGDLPQ